VFVRYIVYVSNFELSTLKIRELRKRDKSRFAELVLEVFVNLGDPTNDLASMLVTPVQRIPRYVMMLKVSCSCLLFIVLYSWFC
jgi:hypothetical protein